MARKGRRVGDRRPGRISEWHPVRQQIEPSRRFNPRTHRTDGDMVTNGKTGDRFGVSRFLKEEETLTIFFKNFPENCSVES